jgi:valyl-tRNA synthetase
LSNENFIGRAPAEIVLKEREALADAESRIKRIEENIAGLE